MARAVAMLLAGAACGSDPVDACPWLPLAPHRAPASTTPMPTVSPPPASRSVSLVEIGLGNADMVPRTTDLWVRGGFGLTGSGFLGTCFVPPGCGRFPVVVWDLSDPTQPVVADTVSTTAALANDVKIGADGRFGVATRELGATGILLLARADDGTVRVAAEFTSSLEGGVHNAWIESIGGHDYVFAAEDGSSPAGGMHIIDVTDICSPEEVASYYAGSSSVHDVLVRDGLAFVSHWDAGLVILDVGNGVAGGSPATPQEVSRIVLPGGATHNAWYWPAGGYVFVGQERVLETGDPLAPAGVVSVVDVRDLAAPAIVATFTRPGEVPPHNFWMDEANGILLVAWYSEGLIAIDVTGDLGGELADQGRELAVVQPGTDFWAPQLENGVVFASTPQGLRVFEMTVN